MVDRMAFEVQSVIPSLILNSQAAGFPCHSAVRGGRGSSPGLPLINRLLSGGPLSLWLWVSLSRKWGNLMICSIFSCLKHRFQWLYQCSSHYVLWYQRGRAEVLSSGFWVTMHPLSEYVYSLTCLDFVITVWVSHVFPLREGKVESQKEQPRVKA